MSRTAAILRKWSVLLDSAFACRAAWAIPVAFALLPSETPVFSARQPGQQEGTS
jgi:hypothetical protein